MAKWYALVTHDSAIITTSWSECKQLRDRVEGRKYVKSTHTKRNAKQFIQEKLYERGEIVSEWTNISSNIWSAITLPAEAEKLENATPVARDPAGYTTQTLSLDISL